MKTKYAPGKNPNSHKILLRKGEENINWKGDKVGYSGLHRWVGDTLGRFRVCSHCGSTTAKRYEWANISKKYKRDVTDWIRLCVSCHIRYDRDVTCKKGHKRTDKDTYVFPSGKRTCKICRRNGDMRRYYERKKMGRKERNFYVVRLES